MNIKNLTVEQKKLLLQSIEKEEKEVTILLKETKEADPFWWYKPFSGTISEKGKEFLRRWILPRDIPNEVSGIEDTFKSSAKIIATFGGNQVGKTTANAIKSHIKITGEVPKELKNIYPTTKLPTKWPVYGRVYGLSNDIIDEVIVPKFREWMPTSYMKDGIWEKSYSKQDKILRYYKNRSKFIGQLKFMSCEKDVSKSQGASLGFAHFDEESPKDFYDEALPRFISSGKKGIDIEFFMTPTNGLTWVYNTIFQNSLKNKSEIECFKVPTITNPLADLETLTQMMEDANSYDEKRMRVLGEFISLGGLIYSGETAINPRIHVIKPFELHHRKYVVVRGIDPHLSKPTAGVELAIDRAGILYVVGTYKKNADTERVKEDLAKRVIERKYRLAWTAFDRSLDYNIKALNDLNVIQKLRMPPNAIPAMIPSEKFDGSIKAGIDTIKQYLKLDKYTKRPKLYFFDTPEVWDLIHEMQTLERNKSRNEAKVGQRDQINEGPKDLHAALRYIFQKPLEYIRPDSSHQDLSSNLIEERYL